MYRLPYLPLSIIGKLEDGSIYDLHQAYLQFKWPHSLFNLPELNIPHSLFISPTSTFFLIFFLHSLQVIFPFISQCQGETLAWATQKSKTKKIEGNLSINVAEDCLLAGNHSSGVNRWGLDGSQDFHQEKTLHEFHVQDVEIYGSCQKVGVGIKEDYAFEKGIKGGCGAKNKPTPAWVIYLRLICH